jgi:hypothetical protein
MRSNFAKTIYVALFALLIGAFLPGIASACTVTPNSANTPADHPLTVDSIVSLQSPQSLKSFPSGEHFWRWDKEKWEHHRFIWKVDNNDAPVTLSNSPTVVTPSDPKTTLTPEGSSLALLGLGVMALGLALGSRRLRPAGR